MAGNASEFVKALMSPVEKLITATQCAIGKVYQPRYYKRMADAKAYEIRQIGNALIETSNIPIVYDKGELRMNTEDFEGLVKRAQNRLVYQELVKQANIDAVYNNAYSNLLDEPDVTSEPIDQDWLIRFFNSVEDISNEQMQELWGKILAGEVKRPNTFSMRTLDTLKSITSEEADLFRRLSPFIITCPGNAAKSFTDYFFPSYILEDDDKLGKYGITFPDILLLSEAGLVNQYSNISITMHLDSGEVDNMVGSQYSIECRNTGSDHICITHTAYVLTEVGKELFPIIFDEQSKIDTLHYMNDFLKSLIDTNPEYFKNAEEKTVIIQLIG